MFGQIETVGFKKKHQNLLNKIVGTDGLTSHKYELGILKFSVNQWTNVRMLANIPSGITLIYNGIKYIGFLEILYARTL